MTRTITLTDIEFQSIRHLLSKVPISKSENELVQQIADGDTTDPFTKFEYYLLPYDIFTEKDPTKRQEIAKERLITYPQAVALLHKFDLQPTV